MKFFSVLIMMATIALTTSAQVGNGISSTALAVFEVGAIMEMSISDGDFGDLLPGVTYQISADGSLTPPDGAGNTEATPVLWEITGQPGANVLLTFSLPPYFEGGGVGGGGVHVPYYAGIQSAGWADASFATGDSYNPIDPRVPGTISLIGGSAAVQVGGTVAVPAGTPDDDYEAQFVLTASYTGL